MMMIEGGGVICENSEETKNWTDDDDDDVWGLISKTRYKQKDGLMKKMMISRGYFFFEFLPKLGPPEMCKKGVFWAVFIWIATYRGCSL